MHLYNPDGDILKHVTDFTIWDTNHGTVHRQRVQRFLLSLPKKQLRGLRSNTKMQLDMFHSVLQSHQTIKTLKVPIFQKSAHVLLSITHWIRSCLGNLESLQVSLRRNYFDVDLDDHSFLVPTLLS